MHRANAALAILIGALFGAQAPGQQANPVYVDDSPQAWELFQLAEAQTAENAGEAVRLYQELLDGYADQLIPRNAATQDEFVSVRGRVLDALRDDPALLQRYRVIETAEATRLLERSQLLDLGRTRPLTEPGLEAMLRLAQEMLESARFRASLAWLEESITHPDLTTRRAGHAWLMYGLSAHYLADRPRVAHARRSLETLGDETRTFLDELLRQTAGEPPAVTVRGVTSLDRSDATGLTELVAQTIWSTELDDTLLGRQFRDPALEQTPQDRKRRQGDLTTVAATVAGNVIYVNEGHTVRALDRFTGRSVWERPYVDQTPIAISSHDNEQASDLNLIAVEGNRLVTLTGHAYADGRSNHGRVVCIDAATGALRWSTSLHRLGGEKEYEDLFPHGGPIIAEGRVYLSARKVTKQSLTGAYVVALDLETGDPDWIRYIASSGSKARTPRPFSALVYDDRDLFVSTAVGAIARLDAARGWVRWLRRQSVPVNLRGRVRRPWELGTSVVLDDRVITLTPDQRRVVVLDRETGDELSSAEAGVRDEWNAPSYLLGTERIVLAVGDDVRAFTIDALDQPLWTLPGPARSLVDGPRPDLMVSALDDLSIVGRVLLAGDLVVVPTLGGILLADVETGAVRHRLAIQASGNPVAVDAQLVLAGPDALDVYMSLDRAEEMLRSRLRSTPDDAAPALSLLQLGLRVGDLDLALEGAELARARVGTDDEAQSELFAMLLELHRRSLATTAAHRDTLYGLIEAIARTTEQRVEARIARGDGLASARPEAAVAAYHQVIAEPTLARVARDEANLVRSSAAWARDRLGRVLDEAGPGVYATMADDARRALTTLRQTPAVAPDAFVALADAYPFTEAATDALDEAVARHRLAGDERQVLAVLSRARALARTDDATRRWLGRFLEACERTMGPAPTRRALRYVASVHGDVLLETSTGPVRPSAWLARLSPGVEGVRRPRVGRPDRPAELISGRVLPLPEAERGRAITDRAFLIDGVRLRAMGGPDLTPLWTYVLDHPSARILRLTTESLLVWAHGNADDPRLIALDTATGDVEWTSPALVDVLEPPLITERGPVTQMPNGLPFDARETLALALDDTIVLVRRTGGLVAFDAAGGGAPLWTLERSLEQVHTALAHPFGIVLSGLGRDVATGALTPRLMIVDAANGAVLHRVRPQSRWGVIWMGADPLGALYCATAEGVEVLDMLTGDRRFTNIAFALMDTRRGWRLADRLVVESRTGSLIAMSLEQGVLTESFDTSARGTWSPDSLEAALPTDDALFARFRDRVVRFDAKGQVRGADIISDPRSYEQLLPVDGDRLVLLSQYDTNQVQIEGAVGRRTQRTYRVYFLSGNCRLDGRSIELPPLTKRIREAQVVDGWLLLSTNADTIAVGLGG